MFKKFIALCGFALLPVTAQADTLITSFLTHLGPPDAYNSSGAPLNDLCAILQQDQANWHRFGNREEYDVGDPFFATAERRAMMAGNCVYDKGYYSNAGARIRNGISSYLVHIQVYVNGSQITRVVIQEGAG